MKRFLTAVILLCIIATSFPFGLKPALAKSVLEDDLTTNITPPKPSGSVFDDATLRSIGLERDINNNDLGNPIGQSYITDTKSDGTFKDERQFKLRAHSDTPYPVNDIPVGGSSGNDGYMNVSVKTLTSFGGVLRVSVKLADINGLASNANFKTAIWGDTESSDNGIFLVVGKNVSWSSYNEINGSSLVPGKGGAGWINNTSDAKKLFSYTLPEAAKAKGFSQTYVPGLVIESAPGFKVPGLNGTSVKIANNPAVAGMSAMNLRQYFYRTYDNQSTEINFEVPFYLGNNLNSDGSIKDTADPSVAGKDFYVQLFVKENGDDFRGFSNVQKITLAPAGVNGAQNWNGLTGTSLTESLADNTGSTNAEQQEEIFGNIIECSATSASSWFTGCLVKAFYKLIYMPTAKILEWAAELMDLFIGYSISSFFYQSDTATFVSEGWRIVRDVSNILFIFLLLWTALNIIIPIESHFNAKKTIVSIILMALLINFSLFFTRVIIDSGNILARVFYNAITTKDTAQIVTTVGGQPNPSLQPAKPLSSAIANGLKVTSMISPKGFDSLKANGTIGPGTMFLVILLGVVVNLIAAWMFFTISFQFLGRILSLWMAMIFSPFAFISTTMHSLEAVPKIGWRSWLGNLLEASFGAAFFIFFIFLIIKFVDSGFLDNILGNADISGGLFIVFFLMQFMFLIGLIYAAKEIAKKMAGEFGGAVAGAFEGAAKFVGGAAIGVAAGGAGLALSRLRGASATAMLESDRGKLLKGAAAGDKSSLSALKNIQAYKGLSDDEVQKRAEKRVKDLQSRQSSSYDVRNSMAGNMFSKATGINLDALGNVAGFKKLSTQATAGGYQGQIDRKSEERRKFIESLGYDKDKVHHLTEEKEAKEKEAADNQDNAAKAKNSSTGKYKDSNGVEMDENGWKAAAASARTEARQKEKEIKDTQKAYFKSYAGFLKNKYEPKGGFATDAGKKKMWDNTKDGTKDFVYSLFNPLKWDIPRAIEQGIVGSLATGLNPVGALAGSIDGLTHGGVLKALNRSMNWVARGVDKNRLFDTQVGQAINLSNRRGETKENKGTLHSSIDISGNILMTKVAENVKDSHFHAGHYNATYKSPNSGFFSIFDGLGKSSAGGGGGGHGGGHDDHGGGGHH